MIINIKITPEEIHKLVADHLRISDPFVLEIVNPNPVEKLPQVLKALEEEIDTRRVSTGFSAGIAELPVLPSFLTCLNDYNWAEVFGEGDGGNCTIIRPDGPLGSDVKLDTFERKDVFEVAGQEEGENDGADWIVWGRLKDGRWFVARGGCDYTGWDCQAGNSGNVASTREDLIAFGMSEGERARFKVPLDADDKSKPVTSR